MGSMRINKKWYPVAGAMAVAGILVGLFFENNYFFSVLCQVMCYFIVALGMNFITGLIGQPNMGAAGVFAIGAYTSALLCIRLGISPWLTIFAVIAMGWLIGKLLGYPSLRVEGVYLSLTTIVFGEIVRILLTNLTDFSGGANGLRNIPTYSLAGISLSKPNHMFIMLVIVSLFMAYIAYRITRSRWGRALIAIRDNVEAVGSCGIKVAKMKVTAFTICCIYVAIGGAMYAHFNHYLNPSTYTQNLSTSFVVMLIVGGLGTISGALIGSVIINVLPELLRFTGIYYQFAYAAIVLLCILFLPGGIVHSFRGARGRLKTKDVVKIFVGRNRGEDHE